MGKNTSISRRVSGVQLSDAVINKELGALHTTYQQAFLKEKEVREFCNIAIAALRKAEKDLRVAAVNLAQYRELQGLHVPRGGVI